MIWPASLAGLLPTRMGNGIHRQLSSMPRDRLPEGPTRPAWLS